MFSPYIETFFIDLNYGEDLKKNLIAFPLAQIVPGKYEDNINSILAGKAKKNVFLYIDPYGIKALKCSLFDKFSNGQFNSIELLINLNSFGFIREACNALGTTFQDKEIFDDLVEYAPAQMDASQKSITELNEIAGGYYWQSIILEYKKGKISGYDAEELFAEKYRQRLMNSYRYVLNMPLRIKPRQRPKYRLIHATNHRDGCLLMVDNICKRWESLQEIQQSGQMMLWEEDCNNQTVDTAKIAQNVIEHFKKYRDWVSVSDALAEFFTENGPICPTSEVRKVLQELEKDKLLDVKRSPDKGKFMIEAHGKTVEVRWKI